MTTRMTPQEIDDFYEAPADPPAPEPIACRNCGSPACLWPGRCDLGANECEACGAPLHEGKCPVCTAPLEAPEEVLDLLTDLIEWDAAVMQSDAEVWDRARAIRDRLVAK